MRIEAPTARSMQEVKDTHNEATLAAPQALKLCQMVRVCCVNDNSIAGREIESNHHVICNSVVDPEVVPSIDETPAKSCGVKLLNFAGSSQSKINLVSDSRDHESLSSLCTCAMTRIRRHTYTQ